MNQRLNFLLKSELDKLFVLEKEFAKTNKHGHYSNRDIAYTKVLFLQTKIIEILKLNYDKLS